MKQITRSPNSRTANSISLLRFRIISALGQVFNFDGDALEWEVHTNTFCRYKYLPELATNVLRYEFVIDRTSIEAFLDSGRLTCVMARELETGRHGYSISTVGEFADLRITRLEIFKMRCIGS